MLIFVLCCEDAAQATALMCTNILSYVLLTERRSGGTAATLAAALEARAGALRAAGRDLGYTGRGSTALRHAVSTAPDISISDILYI